MRLGLGNQRKKERKGPVGHAKAPADVREDSRVLKVRCLWFPTTDHLETWLVPSGTTQSRQYHESTMVWRNLLLFHLFKCPLPLCHALFVWKDKSKYWRHDTGTSCVILWHVWFAVTFAYPVGPYITTVPKQVRKTNLTLFLYQFEKRGRKSVLTFRTQDLVDFVSEGFRSTLKDCTKIQQLWLQVREREREIMLFIGKPKGRSMMISNDLSWAWSEDCFYYCSERNNVVVLFGTLKVQSFLLTEVSDCGLLIVVTSSTFLKR